MKDSTRRLLFAGILWAGMGAVPGVGSRPAGAEPAPAPAEQASLRKEVAELRGKLDQARRAAEQAPAAAGPRKARDEAAAAYEQAQKADPALAAAVKAEKEESADYEKALSAKAAADPAASAALKLRQALDDQRAALLLQDQIAALRLQSPNSPVQRAVDQDAALAKLQQAYRAAGADRAERDAAKGKYDEARGGKLASMPEAKALLDERAQLKQKLAELDEQAKGLDRKLVDARNAVRGGQDPDLAAAKAKEAAARKAVLAARDGEKLKAARETAAAAEKAYQQKINELLEADAGAKEIKAALDARKAQAAQTPAPKAAPPSPVKTQ